MTNIEYLNSKLEKLSVVQVSIVIELLIGAVSICLDQKVWMKMVDQFVMEVSSARSQSKNRH